MWACSMILRKWRAENPASSAASGMVKNVLIRGVDSAFNTAAVLMVCCDSCDNNGAGFTRSTGRQDEHQTRSRRLMRVKVLIRWRTESLRGPDAWKSKQCAAGNAVIFTRKPTYFLVAPPAGFLMFSLKEFSSIGAKMTSRSSPLGVPFG